MSLMSYSIRIGVPTAVDPAGETGPGYWWVTGSARPSLLPESQRLPIRRGHRQRRWLQIWRRGRSSVASPPQPGLTRQADAAASGVARRVCGRPPRGAR